jgi:hypothetical protein
MLFFLFRTRGLGFSFEAVSKIALKEIDPAPPE